MNVLPFSEIFMKSVSGLPSIGEKDSLEIDSVKSNFAEILKEIISENNNFNDIFSHIGKEEQITEKTLGILTLQVMWQLMNKEGMEASGLEQQKINDNLTFIIKVPDDTLKKEEILVIKKAATDLIKMILEAFPELKNQITKDDINIDHLDDINLTDGDDPEHRKASPKEPIESVATGRPVKTSPDHRGLDVEAIRLNNIDHSIFSLTANKDKIEPVPIKIENTTIPMDTPHTDDPEHRKASPKEPIEPLTTEYMVMAPLNTDNTGQDIFLSPVIMAGHYNIEVIITKGDSNETETGQSLIGYSDIEMDGWKENVGIKDAFYMNKAKETNLADTPSGFTEKLNIEDSFVADRITRQDQGLYAGFQHNGLRKTIDHVDRGLEEKIQDISIFSGQDSNTAHAIKKQGEVTYYDEGILNQAKEKLDSENEIKHKTDSLFVLDNGADKGIVRQKSEEVQINRFSDMVQKIENIVEQYSTSKKNVDMLIRFKIDDGEILQFGLKNNGEDILIQIKSTNLEITNMFNDHKDAIIKSLEEKNIFANIFVNPDGARNQEKRQNRQGDGGYRKAEKTVDNFPDILKAQV